MSGSGAAYSRRIADPILLSNVTVASSIVLRRSYAESLRRITKFDRTRSIRGLPNFSMACQRLSLLSPTSFRLLRLHWSHALGLRFQNQRSFHHTPLKPELIPCATFWPRYCLYSLP